MNNAHILGTERIGKLLVQYSIPAIIGMTITSLYNIIDSIFIGHGVGPMGIAGCLFKPFSISELMEITDKCALSSILDEKPDFSTLLSYGNHNLFLFMIQDRKSVV